MIKSKNRRITVIFLIGLVLLAAMIVCAGNLTCRGEIAYATESVILNNIVLPREEETIGDIAVDEEHFPDEVFRRWILNPSNLNGAGSDGILTEEEINNIDTILIRGQSDALIKTLKGIEYFRALKNLSIPYNVLTTLDLNANTELEYVNCSYNRLTKLYVNQLQKLRSFYCEFNYLSELDLSGNTELVIIYCRHNVLSKIDFSNNLKLKFIETFDNRLKEVDVSMLKDLEFLHIDHNDLTRLDMSGNLKLQGGGFVVRNNDVREIILPNIPGFTIYYDDFAEQNPILGYERMEWYADQAYQIPVTGDVLAEGQTLYGKRVPNDYTIHFSGNGGSNVPASINTQYDQSTKLPEQIPTKRGYTFAGWCKEWYESENLYAAGEEVLNLAGKIQGDKVTLYAQWIPNKYTIQFNKNAADADGAMDTVKAEYGKSITLPLNGFTRNGYDFLGWSLTENGGVYCYDRQSVMNLSDRDGDTVTLYAVWERSAEEIRKPYETELEETFSKLTEISYYAEDRNSLTEIYYSAKERLIQAGKDETRMQKIVQDSKKDMSAVPSEETRIQEISEGWKVEFSKLFLWISDPPLPEGKGGEAYILAERALIKSQPQELSGYSLLQEASSREQAVRHAGLLIQEQAEAVQKFLVPAEWLKRAEEKCAIPWNEVVSSLREDYEAFLREYDALSDNDRRYISSKTLLCIQERYRLSQSKGEAVTLLQDVFSDYSSEQYLISDWENLVEIWNQCIADAEQAESEEELEKIIAAGLQAMKDVPTKDEQENPEIPEEPETPPEEKPEEPETPPEEKPEEPETPPEGKPEEPIKPPVTDSNAGNWKWYLIGAAVLVGGVLAFIVYFLIKKKQK